MVCVREMPCSCRVCLAALLARPVEGSGDKLLHVNFLPRGRPPACLALCRVVSWLVLQKHAGVGTATKKRVICVVSDPHPHGTGFPRLLLAGFLLRRRCVLHVVVDVVDEFHGKCERKGPHLAYTE